MRSLPSICGVATAVIALSATARSVVAQENTATLTCQDVGCGNGPPEPLGDRKDHGISVGEYSCRVDSGPMSGGVSTGTDILEWDGTNAVAALGQRRHPQAGLHSGVSGHGGETCADDGRRQTNRLDLLGTKGTDMLATGSAASLAGKPYTLTSKSTGPSQWTVEVKW